MLHRGKTSMLAPCSPPPFHPKPLKGDLMPSYGGVVCSKIAWLLAGGGCAPQSHWPSLPRGGRTAREPFFPFIATM